MAKQKLSDYKESVIKFKFIRPMGLSIEGKGNFFPSRAVMYKEVAGQWGKFPFEDYDFDHVFEIKLEDEFPKPLPEYFDGVDEEIKKQYQANQAKEAAEIHKYNNKVRRELATYERNGYIEVIEDTFLDSVNPKKKPAEASKAAPKAASPSVEPATSDK